MNKILVVFTVDVDRDAANFIVGRKQGGTKTGKSTSAKASYDATTAGLGEILLLLDKTGVPATFFLEGKTALELEKKFEKKLLRIMAKKYEIASHGNEHEDYTGDGTGVKMLREDIEKSIEESSKSIRRVFAVRPQGFRAPYMHYDEELDTIVRRSFDYDSSLYGKKISCEMGFCRIPVYEDADRKGKKISGYLWPLMEGKRSVEDYLQMVSKARNKGDGVVVLATHSWHHKYSFDKGKNKSSENARKDLAKVKAVLANLKAMEGVEFVMMKDLVAQEHQKGRE